MVGRRTGRPIWKGNAVEFTRITLDPARMGGLPCIRGMRIPVATVVGMLGDGMTEDEILATFPDLEREDIRDARRFVSVRGEHRHAD